jgi:hypothetical protein
LQEIIEGKAQPKMSAEWKKELHKISSHDTPKVRNNLKLLATHFSFDI